jgi:hypothetical protein
MNDLILSDVAISVVIIGRLATILSNCLKKLVIFLTTHGSESNMRAKIVKLQAWVPCNGGCKLNTQPFFHSGDPIQRERIINQTHYHHPNKGRRV